MSFNINENITSLQNTKVKKALLLQKHKERITQNLFTIEGIKEIEKAVKSNYTIDSAFFCREIISANEVETILPVDKISGIFEVSKQVFIKMAYRDNSGGIIVCAKSKSHRTEDLKLKENPLILVIESVEKPGNIGALYRTADAAGIDAVIISNPVSDLYNPNTIRASLGCVFTVPTVLTSGKKAIDFLSANQINIYPTSLKASVAYHTVDFTKASAIIMGAEAVGISSIWVESAKQTIIIPMKGEADSMNVSTAAAVVIYEACRQRGFV